MVGSGTVSRRRSPKRDHLLDTAFRLFYEKGYHAVGIDTILAEAGVAKMTLYNHFKSKDELIIAALERRAGEITSMKELALEKAGEDPERKLSALFDFYHRWFKTDDFNGCAFIRALGEYTDPASPIHVAAQSVKQSSLRMLEEICRDLKVKSPKKLAFEIHLLIEGAILYAHTFEQPQAALKAKAAALSLADTADKKI